MKTIVYRQGDVALVVVQKPQSLKEAEKGAEILALGEHSGHGHVAENCEVLTDGGKKYLIPKSIDAQIKHMILASGAKGDHDVLTLPVLEKDQAYEVVIQNIYNPFSKALENVLD